MYILKALGALALASSVAAQNASYCTGGACYALNVPASTASSGTGDIFFQISGPTSMSWIGLGQGNSMSGANIFMIYSNAAGTNVTLSPRLGVGNRQPSATSTANVTLLQGSGIQNGMMIANIKCSNCNSWSGGTMDFTGSGSTNWIYGYKSGSAVNTDSLTPSPALQQHDEAEEFQFSLAQATGGSSANPFVTTTGAAITAPAAAASGSDSTTGSTTGASDGGDSEPSNYNTILKAHAIGGPIAWVLLLPIGAITIRLLAFPGLVYVHAAWMVLSYLLILASMGLGVWLAVNSDQLGEYHSIIGLVVVGALIAQPITGLTHHLLYRKRGRPNVATYPHIWWGRIIITLGIINGGLGLMLSDNTRNGEIAYGVVAGFMWLLWVAVVIFAAVKAKRAPHGETGAYVLGKKQSSENSKDSLENSGRRQ